MNKISEIVNQIDDTKELCMVIERFMCTEKGTKITKEEALLLQTKINKLLLLGIQNSYEESKYHARNAEIALSIALHYPRKRKKISPELKRRVARFNNNGYLNWDWLYEEKPTKKESKDNE